MTRKGSDAEQLARLLKEHDRRLTAIERKRQIASLRDIMETENGFLVETNVTAELYEDDADEPSVVSETHNEATDFADKYLARTLRHIGSNDPRPDKFYFTDGNDEILATTTIDESYVEDNDTVVTGQLEGNEASGTTFYRMGVKSDQGRFNNAPLEPAIELTPSDFLKLKVRFVFLHA